VGIADVVTLTTHKTLRGPRGGAILCGAEWAKKIDSSVFPGLQGGPLEHVVAAKAVAFAEAFRPEFSVYAHAVVENARALAVGLAAEGSGSCRVAPTTTSCWSTCGPSTQSSPARRPRRCSTVRASPATATHPRRSPLALRHLGAPPRDRGADHGGYGDGRDGPDRHPDRADAPATAPTPGNWPRFGPRWPSCAPGSLPTRR